MFGLKWIVKDVIPRPDYTLVVTFASGKRRLFDMKPLLDQKINEPLKNIDFFMQARAGHHTVMWSDELDVCPEYLYRKSTPLHD